MSDSDKLATVRRILTRVDERLSRENLVRCPYANYAFVVGEMANALDEIKSTVESA